MADKMLKLDANKEVFLMRAQLKKQDICKQQWFERWSWLLDERKDTMKQAEAIRQQVTGYQAIAEPHEMKSVKPVPLTSTGFIGWLSSRPDCNLEVYTSWLSRLPVRQPDAWDHPDYIG